MDILPSFTIFSILKNMTHFVNDYGVYAIDNLIIRKSKNQDTKKSILLPHSTLTFVPLKSIRNNGMPHIFICILGNILCFFLQRSLPVSHSDGHTFLPKQGTIIHTVTEYDNLLICQIILFHNFKNAPLFLHRLYQQRIFPEPDLDPQK